ncbi:MAG TPA: MarR family transcriptional regulator [Burkholderiaceae bacterium]|nr:MarR family transcriptional regulator [Burkholderiaceae bacterium]
MDRSKDLFLFRLNRLAATAGRPLIRLCEGKFGITRREWRLIVILAQDGPQLSTALAHRASVEPARASRAITVLVEKGLATRVPRPSDRRFVEIVLTEDGQKVYQSLYPNVESINRALLSQLSEAEQEQLAKMFRVLEAAALRLPEGMPNLPRTDRQRARS